ncbi:MAG: alkaline phosphatase family protein [Acidobacteriota bacterium]|nr:alkaline phosphatase family protein [Acidobacteriota bacterium]
MHSRRFLVCVAALAAAGSCATRPAPAAPQTRPRLIVQLVIDQLHADYPSRYGAQWSKGLHRLVTEGAYFTEAAYPYAGTVTCAGHASIATGNPPAVHGMVLNTWWDRTTRARRPCTIDESVTPIGFTKNVTGRHSGRWLMAPTFVDALTASQPPGAGRVVTMSMKARSAIGLAGHRGDAVVWFDAVGTFATSSAYTRPEWLASYLAAHPIEPLINVEWTRALPASSYIGDDDEVGARPPPGWTPRFPHKLSNGKADAAFYDRWQRSPYSDAYLADMAIAAVDALNLGRGAGVDYLGVSFSATDLVGHKFGPDSHEVQDVLIGADASIGRLLTHLDATVGAGNYVVALSADHGVGVVPESLGTAGGRLARGAVSAIVESVLDARWGDGKYVEDEIGVDLYLTEAARVRLRGDRDAVAAIRGRAAEIPAVADLMAAEDFEKARTLDDPRLEEILLSYHPERSGDILIVLREHFIASTDAASHGTYYAYDRRVPVILFGLPFKAGRYSGAASPLDIAPTWSRLTGVVLGRTYGRSLDAAVK